MSICKHTEFCGGCSMQGISYEQQLAIKEDQVQKLLQEKNIHPREYWEIQGSPDELGYRNKMEYTFGDMVKDGEMTLGMHQKGRFMSIVTVDQCQLVDPDFNRILASVLEFCGQKGYVHYNKKSHQGFLRNLIIRKGVRTGELLVNLVTSSQENLDESAFVSMLESLPLNNKIVGILHTINDGLADFVYCDLLKVLSGRDYYEDEILGLRFRVSAFSFFQTNVDAVERLYREALELLEDPEGKTIYDLYCGTGTISQALAIRAGHVIGVELVEEAVTAARINAELNGLKNCDFIAGDVLKVLDQVDVKPDVIVVDPPRMGIHPKAMDKIFQYGVPQILYISCNPKTLAENLQHVNFYGYEVSVWKTYDNFPYTKHVETVVLLSHKKADTHINVNVEFGEGEGKIPVGKIVEKAEDYRSSERVTYKMIQEYIESKYGFKVHTSYVAEVKRDLGLPMYDAPNAVEELKRPRKRPTIQKVEAIRDALRHFSII